MKIFQAKLKKMLKGQAKMPRIGIIGIMQGGWAQLGKVSE